MIFPSWEQTPKAIDPEKVTQKFLSNYLESHYPDEFDAARGCAPNSCPVLHLSFILFLALPAEVVQTILVAIVMVLSSPSPHAVVGWILQIQGSPFQGGAGELVPSTGGLRFKLSVIMTGVSMRLLLAVRDFDQGDPPHRAHLPSLEVSWG